MALISEKMNPSAALITPNSCFIVDYRLLHM